MPCSRCCDGLQFWELVFRRAYDALVAFGGRADVEYLRILHLAASTMEQAVEASLLSLLDADVRFDFDAVRAQVSPAAPVVPHVAIPGPDLTAYDRLLVYG